MCWGSYAPRIWCPVLCKSIKTEYHESQQAKDLTRLRESSSTLRVSRKNFMGEVWVISVGDRHISLEGKWICWCTPSEDVFNSLLWG